MTNIFWCIRFRWGGKITIIYRMSVCKVFFIINDKVVIAIVSIHPCTLPFNHYFLSFYVKWDLFFLKRLIERLFSHLLIVFRQQPYFRPAEVRLNLSEWL